jgi:competence protein ComEA
MWEMIRGYLTFTRKERMGVLFLLILVSALFVLPYMCRPAVGQPDLATYDKMKDEIRQFESATSDSARIAVEHGRYNKYSIGPSPESAFAKREFYYSKFRYGSARQPDSRNVNYYPGNRFPYDGFRKVNSYTKNAFSYSGFRNDSYAKNPFPYKDFRKSDSFIRSNSFPRFSVAGQVYKHKTFELTDVNHADSAEWSLLPGIGARLASRIVHFREKLGGFCGVDQVSETFGLPDSTYQSIKPYLRLHEIALNQIDINNATEDALQAHPYIRWKIAKAIVEYRNQHGGFHEVKELLQLAQMDTAKFDKLRPYLVVNK